MKDLPSTGLRPAEVGGGNDSSPRHRVAEPVKPQHVDDVQPVYGDVPEGSYNKSTPQISQNEQSSALLI